MICEEPEEDIEDPEDTTTTDSPPAVSSSVAPRKICPLLEQLRDNLNFWKAKPKVTGQDAINQMDEAFSTAYPIVLSRGEAAKVEEDLFL